EEDVMITHVISGAVVRSSEPDPYTSSDAFTLLSQFRNEWLNNQGAIQRDVAHLFTGKSIQGGTIGIAWTIGGICTTSGYCLSESDFNNALVCATDLTAHELGHLWNGSHCNCNSFTMNPSITCANNFNPNGTIPDIIAHRNSRTCLDSQANPSNDNFVDSIAVGSLPANVGGTNVNATTEGGEPNLEETGATVWWNATAPSTGIMTVSTEGSAFDTQLQIYTGNSVGDLSIVASNDDYRNSLQSEISFPVTAGQRYEIRVGGFTNGGTPFQGTVNLAVSFAAAGPTDFFWSTRDFDMGADNDSNPVANFEVGTSGSIYLYYDPTNSDVDTGAFFDIVTSNPGVIEFTNAVSFEYDITVMGTPVGVRWGDASGQVGDVTSDSIDEFGAFTVVSGDGMVVENTGPTFIDEGYDAAAGAFLFGRLDFTVVGAAGTSVSVLSNPGSNGIVNDGNLIDSGLGVFTINVTEPLPAETDFFWSTADLNNGATNGSMLMATASEGDSGALFLYYDTMVSEIDTGAFLDIMTSSTGVIEFTNATAFDFDILAAGTPFTVRWGDSFGETGVLTPDFIDEFGAFTVVSGTGILNENTGPTFLDTGYDPSTGAFLFGRIDYNVVGSAGDMVDISVTAGTTGIVNNGVALTPTFGVASILVTDSVLLGDINCDGAVNLLDVDPFIDLLSNGEFSAKADFNGDGVVSLLDVGPFVDALNDAG
ncbi:MAG: M12 family metallo-peptidase, partial [Planctomycetota bacterium]